MRLNTEKCKGWHLGRKNPRHLYRLERAALESSPAEKGLGVVEDKKLSFRTASMESPARFPFGHVFLQKGHS